MTQPKIKILQLESGDLDMLFDSKSIESLGDVVLSSPSAGEILVYSGSPLAWRSAVLTEPTETTIVDGDGIDAVTGSPLGTIIISVDSTVARRNDVNTFTQTNTLTSAVTGNSAAGSLFQSSAPGFIVDETDSAANESIWRVFASAGTLTFDIRNDAGSITNNWLTVGRTGATVGTIALTGSALTFNSNQIGALVYTPTTANTAINSVTDVTIVTRGVTNVAAGDQIIVDAWCTILNNSGATRVITFTLDFNGLFDIEIATAALAQSATLIHPFHIKAVLDVRSTSLCYEVVSIDGFTAAGMVSGADTTMAANHLQGKGWGTSASNVTGTTTVTLVARSANAAATQTLRLHSFNIRKVRPTI